MSQHRAISGGNHRFVSGLLLGALASCALAVASLGSAGVANAASVSFSGFHNARGCETTNPGDIAVGLGPRHYSHGKRRSQHFHCGRRRRRGGRIWYPQHFWLSATAPLGLHGRSQPRRRGGQLGPERWDGNR